MNKIGIIGGSGLYQLDCGEALGPVELETPYGKPSGAYQQIRVDKTQLFFLSRHGAHHSISPSEINYRANVYGFKKLGCEALISVSAVGSMRDEIKPGQFVLPDQYLDFTKGTRRNTFFGEGVVGHAPFADPACATLRETLFEAGKELGITVYRNGTYVCIEGPQFSSRSESHFYRSLELKDRPVSVIGMTALPEARLAREAGLCYQTVAMATDYDCWRESDSDVSVEEIIAVLLSNVATSKKWVESVAKKGLPACKGKCRSFMKTAVLTPPEHWPQSRREALSTILE